MKSWYYKLLCVISAMACWTSATAVNSPCNLVLYEPEMPEELSEMLEGRGVCTRETGGGCAVHNLE